MNTKTLNFYDMLTVCSSIDMTHIYWKACCSRKACNQALTSPIVCGICFAACSTFKKVQKFTENKISLCLLALEKPMLNSCFTKIIRFYQVNYCRSTSFVDFCVCLLAFLDLTKSWGLTILAECFSEYILLLLPKAVYVIIE